MRVHACAVTVVAAAGLATWHFGCSSHTAHPRATARVATPPPPPPVVASDGSITVRSLGVPVKSTRIWTTAIAQNPRGGWNFIAQAYEYPSNNATEWIVLDLATGKQTSTAGPAGVYANNLFHVRNELRAPNGRIFFPELGTNVAYYDPNDETVKQLGPMVDPPGPNKLIYQMVLGPNGKLYGTTQSKDLPTVFELDPDTLQHRVIGTVGKDRVSYSYGYSLAVEPPWIYVAVGKNPWELAAININSGDSRVLTRLEDGAKSIDFDSDGAEIRAHLRDSHDSWVRCAKGAIATGMAPKRRDPRGIGRGAAPGAPEIDESQVTPTADGVGHVLWRADGSSDAWQDRPFKVSRVSGIDIESLLALPDGTVLGNAKQYHGFFRYDPRSGAITSYGAHGPSRGARLVMGKTAYLAGYPNGVLYAFDFAAPWTAKWRNGAGSAGANPSLVGRFKATGTKYASFLAAGPNGRLYYAGRREREGTGAGVGWYDPATSTFGGHHDGLEAFTPGGLLADAASRSIVLSTTQVHPGDPDDAKLVIYDYELHEKERIEVKPGLASTGEIFAVPGRLLGVVVSHEDHSRRGSSDGDDDGDPDGTGQSAIYTFDLPRKTLLSWQDLPGRIHAVTQRPSDGSLWLVIDDTLARVDPVSAAVTTLGRIESASGQPVRKLAWQGPSLFASAGSELLEIVVPDSKP
jgi:hypothetical protein